MTSPSVPQDPNGTTTVTIGHGKTESNRQDNSVVDNAKPASIQGTGGKSTFDNNDGGPMMKDPPTGCEYEFGNEAQERFACRFQGQMCPDRFKVLFQMHKIQGELDKQRLGGDILLSSPLGNMSRLCEIGHTESRLMTYEWGKLQSEYMEGWREKSWFSEKLRHAYEKGELEWPSDE